VGFLSAWMARILFYGTALLALALAATVGLAPWVAANIGFGPDVDPILRIFADDGVVRRTALASAAGLLVTAFVFFRPALLRARAAARARRDVPSSNTFAGA
jgi:hypothetical protein